MKRIYQLMAEKYFNPIASVLIGIISFLLITGGKIIRPSYVDWLMEGDPATHWLGWHFFRNSPLLQWPIGANPKYGMEIGSSIIFTDSIPLLALLFKPFNIVLPQTFQYFGLWVCVSFILQAFFAWKLLSSFADKQDRWLPLIGCAFFAIAPVQAWRLLGHYALVGHWILIAALYLYVKERFTPGRWIGLLAIAALVHLYLLVMVALLWFADLLQQNLKQVINKRQTFVYLLLGLFSTSIVLWCAGAFMVGKGVDGGSLLYGTVQMNVLALIDPTAAECSKLLKIQCTTLSFEGFNYLGIGIVGLGFIAAYELFKKKLDINWSFFAPLLLVVVLLGLFAISNKIVIGNHTFLSYPLPAVIHKLFSIFRASGRMFWPVYYMLYLVVFYIMFKSLDRRRACILCLFFLIIQLVDSSNMYKLLRNRFNNAAVWSSPLQSPAWNDIAKQYKQILYVLPNNNPKDWLPLTHFAATHAMAINIGYFARVNPKAVDNAQQQIIKSIERGDLHTDALYVFDDDRLWQQAKSRANRLDCFGTLDGYKVLAPQFKACSNGDNGNILETEYQGQKIFFGSKGTGLHYLQQGWSSPEGWGVWSDGKQATIKLRFQKKLVETYRHFDMELDTHAYITKQHPMQHVEVMVNNQRMTTLEYTTSQNSIKKISIPASLLLQANGVVEIVFRCTDAVSPKVLGAGDDTRILGLGLISLRIQPGEV